MNRYSGAVRLFVIIFITVATIYSCANRGSGPQGGPKDTTPPRIIKYMPENNSTNTAPQKINLTFDEIVLVENSYEKVIISPPQTNMPLIKALGHKISVELKDSLKPNTTYTINFTDAIVDNNEKNKLDGFVYSFATGDFIDTLAMSGIVLDSKTLNPVPNIIVGIHSNMEDSAFTSLAFDRITKTNDKGEFIINNIHEGSYHIYALSDIGNNYFFDIPTERIAFSDSVYTPTCTAEAEHDTVFSYAYLDSARQIIDSTQKKIDTVITKYSYTYAPENIVLMSFLETNNRQYLSQSKREQPYNFTLCFGNKCDTLPRITPLNLKDSTLNYMLQISPGRDTLTYWLKDSAVWNQDTLMLQAAYKKIDEDSSYWQTDTLSLIYRAPKQNAKQKRVQPEIKKEKILKSNASSKFDIYNPLRLYFTVPTTLNDTLSYTLQEKVDTTWRKIPAALRQTDSLGFDYEIKHNWKPETTYKLSMDSGLFVSLTNISTDRDSISLTTKSLEEYSTLVFTIKDYKGTEVIQILDNKDKIIRQVKTTSAKTKIEFLAPGTYYARLFLDENNNNEWDTGSYKEKRQAEKVYYFPYDIELRAFWDVEEDWNINEFPIQELKPKELLKSDTGK